jgi:hypothetical protein
MAQLPIIQGENNDFSVEITRDLSYYRNIDKVFWVVASDILDLFKRYENVPCLFVEKNNNSLKILKFDYSIELDSFKYTAWRKVLGKVYNIRVDVLLIGSSGLYDLEGVPILFESLGRSEILVDKKYLGIMDLKEI